jgi:rubredoxin
VARDKLRRATRSEDRFDAVGQAGGSGAFYAACEGEPPEAPASRTGPRETPRRESMPLSQPICDPNMKTWMCLICGWIYDEAAGAPEEGLAPGTRWEDVPMNWTCPECGARKEDFELIEV